ncbi:universal stress protein [Achromobacter aloeverae]
MFKRIAVHIDKDPACEGRVATAMALAQTYTAHIVGIYVQDPPYNYAYGEAVIPSAILEVQQQQIADERHKCSQEFCHLTASAGLGKSWIAVEGLREEELALQARCSDLLILSQADLQTHRSSIEPYQLESVVMTAGRPVLVVPYEGKLTQPVERVLICWDRGRESARAIADAAPFLSRAKEIAVLTVDEAPAAAPRIRNTMHGLDDYLRAHGYVEAKPVSSSSKGIGIGNAILNTASDCGADLIVMGLYGHSRAREWMLGGASREMLESMTVPVLFSH